MVIKKRKKNTRQRGSRTHGWGLVHRNSGQRGGAGNAGRGKKAHSNKPTNWLDKDNPRYFGKHGFIHHGAPTPDIVINIKDIENRLQTWIAEKKATQNGTTYEINLTQLSYTKLLSSGTATKKLKITITTATETAIKKIVAAGGNVILPEKKKAPTTTPKP